jgi:hypothetical protein
MNVEDTGTAAADVVREFWRLMGTNDFRAVGAVLAADFILDWPQSNERVRGAENFAAMNAEYPAHGPWSFKIIRLVGNQTEAVSEVTVTDGTQHARAISFFTIAQDIEQTIETFTQSKSRKHGNNPGHRSSSFKKT